MSEATNGETVNYSAAIEAILFASGASVETGRIAQALGVTADEARQHIEALAKAYNDADRGITIIKLKDSYQMVSRKAYAPQIRTVMDLRRN